MELEDRVRDLEEKVFRQHVEKEAMLLVMAYLVGSLMPTNPRAKMAKIAEVEARIDENFPKLRSEMTAVQTDAYVDEMQEALGRILGVIRDGCHLPRR